MVGTSGFEPLTSCTPSMRATRLRHAPTALCLKCMFSLKLSQRPQPEIILDVGINYVLGKEKICSVAIYNLRSSVGFP